MNANRGPRHFDRRILVIGLAGLIAGYGCRLSQSQHGMLPTRSDRLVQFYQELQSGRFAVIADFEDPVHMELVQLTRVSPQADFEFDHKHGRPETGQGCLKLISGSPDDTLIIGNENATQWYLKRDWRDYDLLMMAIHSPRRDLDLEVSIAAGTGGERLAVESSWPLEPGWNVIRLDLGAVGEHLPLDDVRDLRLAVAGAAKPTSIYLDDIILTGSRKVLLGDPLNRDGSLYVQKVARRWNIGAGGKFELTFAYGQIIGWYNLLRDPYRLKNLAQGTTLGPSPVTVNDGDEAGGAFSALGRMVVAHPRIVEMNRVRAVVTCDWRFVDQPDAPLDDRPFQRWVYTIYPTGQMYATVECTTATSSWSAPPFGLAVTFASTSEDELQTHETMAAQVADSAELPVHAWAKSQLGQAGLMYVLAQPTSSTRIIEKFDENRHRASFVAIADDLSGSVRTWQAHVYLDSAGKLSSEEFFARAVDYTQPAGLSFEVGSAAPPGGTGDDFGGFDWGSGCYKIRPERGCVRFSLSGREQLRFSPVFEVIDPENREAWVYINHLIYVHTARSAAGNLIFQLPDIIRDETHVEVLFRRARGSGAT